LNGKNVNDLPQMTLRAKGQAPISATSLSGKVILIFFQPDCDHCQREAKEINEHLDSFNDYKIYFVTTENFDLIDKFAKDYNLTGHVNVQFVQTTLNEILNTVGPISAPSMFIYANRTLIKHLDGETPIDEILKYL
jgi:peroxiredoxin